MASIMNHAVAISRDVWDCLFVTVLSCWVWYDCTSSSTSTSAEAWLTATVLWMVFSSGALAVKRKQIEIAYWNADCLTISRRGSNEIFRWSDIRSLLCLPKCVVIRFGRETVALHVSSLVASVGLVVSWTGIGIVRWSDRRMVVSIIRLLCPAISVLILFPALAESLAGMSPGVSKTSIVLYTLFLLFGLAILMSETVIPGWILLGLLSSLCVNGVWIAGSFSLQKLMQIARHSAIILVLATLALGASYFWFRRNPEQ